MKKKVTPMSPADKQYSKLLEKVPPGFGFVAHDGSVFNDMHELAAGLQNMSDETYAHHVNLEKHDFSSWVRNAIGDDRLADSLAQASSREQAARNVFDRLQEITGQ